MGNKILSILKTKENVLKYVEKKYKSLVKDLKRVGSERQDLLHILELNDLRLEQEIKIVKELKKVQIKRRKIKDELRYYKKIMKYIKNNGTDKEIPFREIEKKVKEVESGMGNRVYEIRVRRDLLSMCNDDFV